MRLRGQISVLLSLLMVSIAALLGALLESARLAAVHSMLSISVNAAAESVLAEYNVELWEEYDLLFLDAGYGRRGIHPEEVERRARGWLEDRWTLRNTVLPAELREVRLTGYQTAVEQGGEAFMRAIEKWLESYWVKDWNEPTGEIERKIEQGLACYQVLERMAGAAEKAFVLEGTMGKTAELLREIEALEEEIDSLSAPETEGKPEAGLGSDYGSGGESIKGGLEDDLAQSRQRLEDELSESCQRLEDYKDDYARELREWEDSLGQVNQTWEKESREQLSGRVKRRIENMVRGFSQYNEDLHTRWRQVQAGDSVIWNNTLDAMAPVLTESRRRQCLPPIEWLPDCGPGWDGRASAYGIRPPLWAEPVSAWGKRMNAWENGDGWVFARYVTEHFSCASRRGSRGLLCEAEYILTGEEGDRQSFEETLRRIVERLGGCMELEILEDESRFRGLTEFSGTLEASGSRTGVQSLLPLLNAYLLNAQGFDGALENAETLCRGGTVKLWWENQSWEFNYEEFLRQMLSKGWDNDLLLRCMGLVEHNLQGMYPDFSLAQCLSEIGLQAETAGRFPGRARVVMGY